MERSGLIVLTLVSLVTASPYGYGAKSGAVAKAEANAGAAAISALPSIPLSIPSGPGFSGSFSKSSSSSFASSSASSSSSSSSFSYSGAGTNVIPGVGSGCLSGVCDGGNNELGSTTKGSNGFTGSQGHNINSASAGAKATASIHTPNMDGVNGPCAGPNCNGYGISGNKCAAGGCDSPVNTNGNGPEKCTSGSCIKPVYSGSSSNSQTENDNLSNDNNVNIAGKAGQNIQSPLPNTGSVNEPQSSSPNTQSFLPLNTSGKKFNKDNVKTSDCESPDCDTFIPNSSASSNNNAPNIYKPSTHLETPYRETGCTSHGCISGSPSSNSGSNNLPSSYNVPIIGNDASIGNNGYKPSPNCQNGKCPPSYDGNQNIKNPSYPGQSGPEPSGSGLSPSCTSGICAKPSYQPYVPTDTDKGFKCTSGDCASSSYQPNVPGIPNTNPSCASGNCVITPFQPSGQTKPDAIPSFQSNSPTTTFVNPSFHPSGASKPGAHSTFQPSGPTGTYANPSIQPSGVTGPQVIPSSQHSGPGKPYEKPSFPSSSPTGPHTNPAFQPSGPVSPGVNPSFQPGIPTGSYANPSVQPIDATEPREKPTPSGPQGNSYHQPSGPTGTHVNPSHPSGPIGPYEKPFQPNGPTGSQAQPSFLPGSQTGPTFSHTDASSTQISQAKYPSGCTSSGCFPGSNSNLNPSHPGYLSPKQSDKPQVTAPTKSNNHYGATHISASPESDSSVLLSNKGNKIYTGGFNGPSGILSANNGPPIRHSDKPNVNGIIVNPSQTNGPYDNSHNYNAQPNPQPAVVLKPGLINVLSPNGSPSNNDATNVHPSSHVSLDDKDKPVYTGGFGGPGGLLKPNEHTIQPQPANQKPACSSANCGTNPNQLGSSNGGLAVANAVAKADAVAYSGGFGGPPGLLKAYDGGKVDGNVQQNLNGKHANSQNDQNVGTSAINNNLQPQNLNGALSGAQANAVASASATAIGGSFGQLGGCNSCSNDNSKGHGNNGVKNTFNQGSVANASASAKSIATSYAQGGSVASASAHASAGASHKGYAWR